MTEGLLVLVQMLMYFKECEDASLKMSPYCWKGSHALSDLGQAVFRSKMKEIGLSVACLHPTGSILPSTALL